MKDEEGLPFVGRAGMLLDKMLAAINLDRKKVYISNILIIDHLKIEDLQMKKLKDIYHLLQNILK